MKKLSLTAAIVCCLILTACGTLGTVLNTGNLGDVITSVIGFNKVTKQQLIGSWRYTQPGVAFSSSNLLAKAGGEVAAAQDKEKLLPYYQQIGFSSANTQITFNSDGSFNAIIDDRPVNGQYTLDESSGALKLKTLLFSLNGYTKRTNGGISVLFESKKILTLFQYASSMSSNAELQKVGELSKYYDGVRIGFDMAK